MIHLISENFNQHSLRVPGQTPGMKVVYSESLTYVDCGLSCDTFNIIHILNGEKLTKEELNQVLQYYRQKNFKYCIWISDENLTPNVLSIFTQLSIQQQNKEPGMMLDLSAYQPVLNELHTQARRIETSTQLYDYSTSIAANWSPPDQNVKEYYKRVAEHILNKKNNIILTAHYENNKPVSVIEMFPTDSNTIGLYGLATLAEYRGRGIGSALMTYSLNMAKELRYKYVILQASEDGFGIYQKFGFKVYTTYYEYV
jgi:ribosomal protein S18 acetylase RimI-like enzyme